MSSGATSIARLLTKRARFLVECLDLPGATQIEDARWEPFQIDHLNDNSPLRLAEKARQIAWSFIVAAEATAFAMLDGLGTAFVSINLSEAGEKVRYAKAVYENLQIAGLPKIVADNTLGLEFDNGARILSLPGRPPRGKSRMNVVLDEFAHVQQDRKIYTAALPILSKGGIGRIGSSPMGAVGTFWEISRQELRQYPGYKRVSIPWWRVAAFCKGGLIPLDAEGMETHERVERYGNDRIQMIYDNMPLEDFQQEYECLYVDEAVSFITWELIRANQDDTLKHWHAKSTDEVIALIPEIKAAIAAGEIEDTLIAGVDIGRKKNLTEVIFQGCGQGSYPVRLMVSLEKVKFDDQQDCLAQLLRTLPVSGMLIDQNGIGMHLAENLEEHTHAQGVNFTNKTKEMWANELKIQMERGNTSIPCDKDLAYQIHSIKKAITPAGNAVYDTSKNEEHHADKLWALALSTWLAREHANRPEWGTGIPWQRR